MKRKSIYVVVALFVVIVALSIASYGGEKENNVNTPVDTYLTTTSETSTTFSSNSDGYSVVAVEMLQKTFFTSISVNPRVLAMTILYSSYEGGKEFIDTTIVDYMESGGTTTELMTIIGLMSSRVITAYGSESGATVIVDGTTSSMSYWKPFVVGFFERFTPYYVSGSTVVFTAGGDVLETTSLYEFGTSFLIDHTYEVVASGNTFRKVVKVSGSMGDFSTVVEVSVYTFPVVVPYMWLRSGTAVVPSLLISGMLQRVKTVFMESVTSYFTEFFSVDGTSLPLVARGYQVGSRVTVSGTNAIVEYAGVKVVATRSGDVYVVTAMDTSDTSSSVVTTDPNFVFHLAMYVGPVELSSVLINSTPVLVLTYKDAGVDVIITYDRDFAVVRGNYKLFTDSSGGYIILSTYGVWNFGVVGVVTTAIEH